MAPGRSRPAGYSGTPLAKKLGVKPGHRIVLVRRPRDWSIPDLPADVAVVDVPVVGVPVVGVPGSAAQVAGVDAAVVVAFHQDRAGLEREVPDLVAALAPTSALWIAWPRRAGGHESDITESLLRELFLPTGVVDVKVAALDTDWSGLKFVWRKERRPGAGAAPG